MAAAFFFIRALFFFASSVSNLKEKLFASSNFCTNVCIIFENPFVSVDEIEKFFIVVMSRKITVGLTRIFTEDN